MRKLSNKPVRVDPIFAQTMGEIAKIRLNKGLSKLTKEELSIREQTRLLTKTDGFKKSLEELKFKPKRENLI